MRANVKAQEVPARRTVLATSLEEQESDDTELLKAEGAEFKRVTKKTIRDPGQRLVLIVPVEQQDRDVYGTNPSDAKNRKEMEGKGPGYPVYSTKVPETTLKDASVTYKQSPAYENETQGKEAAGILTRQSPSIGSRGLKRKGKQMRVTTKDHENVDLKPATANLDIEIWSPKHETTDLVDDASLRLTCSLVYKESLCLICPARRNISTKF